MGALIRARDWSATPLGPVESWPQSLRSAVSILLPSKAQIALFWGPDLVTLYNDAYRPVFGAKHPHALGQPIRESWSELWRAGLQELFERVLQTGEAYWAKDRPFYMERHGYPEETFFDVSYDPVRDESGAVGGVFCIVSETTGRVLGERRLKVLRDLAAAPAEARSVGEACELSARALAADPGDIPFSLIYLFDAERRKACLAAASGVAPGAPISPTEADVAGCVWPLGPGGRVELLAQRFGAVPPGPWPEAPTAAVVLPIADRAQESALGALVLGISARLAFNDDYRSFFELVAGQIAASIANARASEEERRRAEALAELDRAKTAFFSNVSHEFRTPLTLMLGPIEDALGESAALPQAQRERLELARRSALRLQKLVNTLLDFSRIEAGRAQATYLPTDLAGLTADLASSFRSAVEKAGLRLDVDCAPLAEPVYVDRDMWEKVVLNLLSNALKFTFEGAVSVSLRQKEGRVELAVRDTGTGIPAAELPHIFERFRRVEGAKSRTHEGTGIGLALVQELVRLHGGTVRVQSAPGAGSSFTVSLPLGCAHLPAERVETQSALASTALGADAYVEEALRWLPDAEDPRAAPANVQRSRILWADDNADMREYVSRLLAGRYEVQALADGAAALAAARASPPDLVLADVMMPELDGLGLARALRADPRTQDVPVILLSARAGGEARLEGLEAGADDYLYKPFTARELLGRISARLELRRLQARIQQERSALAELFAQTPVPTAVLRGPELVFEMANPAYLAVVGGREVVGKPLLEALPEAKGQGFDELLREVMRTGRAYVGHEQLVKLERNGRIEDTYFTFIYAPLRGPTGEIDRAIAIVNEVTDQVLARRRIAESEERYRRLVALLPAAVYTCEASCGVITFYNEHAARLWGRAPKIGETDERFCGSFRLWRPDGRALPHHETPMALAMREGREFRNQEVVIERPDGSRITALVNIDPIRDERGAVTGAINVFHDTTALKAAEEATALSEERYRKLVSVITDVPWTTDAEGRFVAEQPAWSAYTGHGWERHRGFGWAEALHPDDRARVLATWAQACRARGLYESHGRLWHAASGAYRHFVVRATPLLDAQGNVREWVGTCTDVHERVVAEVALKDADRRKDEFLAMLSHELRNPLAPIRNAVTLLAQAGDERTLRSQACSILERQVSHMIRLVDDLLDISRISRGSIGLHKQVVDLAPILESALETSRPLIEAGGHRLRLSTPREPVALLADPVRFAQVISNLLNNAAKYTPQGGVIELSARVHAGMAEILVRDNGMGIPPEALPHVFDMFAQAEASRLRVPGGLGVGLALARQLVELHGGRIEAKSEGAGRGSEFTVRVPLLASARPLLVGPPPQEASMARRRVLVVDDNVDAAQSLGMVLEQMGHAVEVAYDGRAALAAAQANPPDLILADIDLPQLDGFGLAARLKADPRFGRVPIVAVTGFGQELDRKRSQQAGFDAHLVKPLDAGVLRSMLAKVAANGPTV